MTNTPSPVNTPNAYPTATVTPTPTLTPTQPGITDTPGNSLPLLSSGGASNNERNGAIQETPCWDNLVIDLGKQTQIVSLVYYDVNNSSHLGMIGVDWVIVYIRPSLGVPWKLVFYWADGNRRNNGNIPPGQTMQENGAQPIMFGDLKNQTGIEIPVWRTTQYVLSSALPRCDDPTR
jgi:hypothetical protein